MKNFILMLTLVPGISIIFAYTKANVWSFWLGFVLCLIGELSILIFYCFIKLQKAYRDSFTIKIQESNHLLIQTILLIFRGTTPFAHSL